MRNDLPIFPKFEKLSLDHRDLLQSFSTDFPSSDFNFAGLFTWDVDDVVTVSALNGNIVICSSDYLTRSKFYSFIGNNKIDETVKTLIDHAEQNGESPVLRLIPESVTKHISPTAPHIVDEDPDNHDYMYLVTDWAELKGGKYVNKRNLVHGFGRKYGALLEEKELDLADENVRKDIEAVMLRWQSSRRKTDEDVRDEIAAVQRAVKHYAVLGMKALGIYHGGNLIAFILFEILPDKTAVGHFEKADTQFEGVFVYLKHILAKHLEKLGVEFINTEQDLGVEGLRRSKQSLHPAGYIKKYTIKPRS
jgi:hypothetical protein